MQHSIHNSKYDPTLYTMMFGILQYFLVTSGGLKKIGDFYLVPGKSPAQPSIVQFPDGPSSIGLTGQSE